MTTDTMRYAWRASGAGANLCGKLLGELGAVYLGLNSASFSSYGSEKRGSPVKAFIRWCAPDKDMRINSPVEKPHMLGLFHEAMAGKQPVTPGWTNTPRWSSTPAFRRMRAREQLKLAAGELFCVDGLTIAMESKTPHQHGDAGRHGEGLGLHSRWRRFDQSWSEDTVGKEVSPNCSMQSEGVKRGYTKSSGKGFDRTESSTKCLTEEARTRWGYENAPIGGVNPHIGSTVSNDLSAPGGLYPALYAGKVYQLRLVRHHLPGYGVPV